MDALIAALTDVARPLVNAQSVFFGHSMGAGVAFELVRALRRARLPLPRALIVSGARSPQYRLTRGPLPELTDEELATHIHTLGIPLLRVDLRLYRNYVYIPEDPLPIPIFAYGGETDRMDEWREQTSAAFRQRTFPGGHFPPPELVLAALADDLTGRDA